MKTIKSSILTRTIVGLAGLALFGGALTGCQSAPPVTNSTSLEDLMGRKSLSDQDRDKIVTAAQSRAELELSKNDPRAAIHFAKIAARFDETNPETQTLLGRSYMAFEDYATARKIFTQYNKSASTAQTLEYQGLAEFHTGDMISAEKTLDRALGLDSSLWQSAAILGRITRSKGEHSRSQSYFEQAFAVTDNAAKVHDHKGHAALTSKDWTGASRAFEEAQRLSGGLIGLHAAYRVSKAKTGDMVSALNLASDEETAQLYQELAKISLNEGDRVAAIKYLQRAQAISPKYNEETERLLTAAKAMKS